MGDKGEDIGEGMQCSEHPYRKNPGGICAFCLQEKLGKLVSSSKSNSFYPIAAPSSSSSSPSFRSDGAVPPSNQIPFFAHKKKKVMSSTDANLILKRSRSVAVPRHLSSSDASDDSPRKKSFWSFLHLSRRRALRDGQPPPPQPQQQAPCAGVGRKDSNNKASSGGDENESPNSSHASSAASSSFGRKVARSRSVGCGSRSFSGDLLERISTGLGDCALRRVESQREAKPKMVLHRVADNERIKQRVKCGGIFGGFGMSSSSSSSYWLSDDFNGRISSGPTHHGRNSSRSWGWAFASPMRAFRPSNKSYIATSDQDAGKRRDHIHNAAANNTSTTTNHIGASPSLLAVRS
ncbi:uncharacterized protein LOC131239186 [Magnolia sinica]|uniref:uncharacterized protein LOC131239186 n=1 Tax=Magnolia sinica TaxID=86752 RepID=UPI002659397E|nr:uncharacterized protein LOC131239186 [Magnolia sinica]